MKKILLSAFVVLLFIAYSFQQRNESSGLVIAPKTLTQNTQNTQNTSSSSSQPSSQITAQPASPYKDGNYTGSVADAFYGNIQVQITIQSGKITDVKFLQSPNDRPNSIEINRQAMPLLKQEAIMAQSSHVDSISGATDTSAAFVESLSAALAKAV